MKTVLLLLAPQPPLKGYFFPLIFGSALLSVIVLFHSYFSTGHVKRIKALYLIVLVVYFFKMCSGAHMFTTRHAWSRCLVGNLGKIKANKIEMFTRHLCESFPRWKYWPGHCISARKLLTTRTPPPSLLHLWQADSILIAARSHKIIIQVCAPTYTHDDHDVEYFYEQLEWVEKGVSQKDSPRSGTRISGSAKMCIVNGQIMSSVSILMRRTTGVWAFYSSFEVIG